MWGSREQQQAFGRFFPLWFGPSDGQARRAVVLGVRPLAEDGYAPAQFTLALAHMDAQGVRRDYAESFRWARLAAEQRYPSAEGLVASYYRMAHPKHHACDLDLEESVRWLRRAAEGGNPGAQFNLANACLQGSGLDASPVEAFVWASLAIHSSPIRMRPAEVLRDHAAAALDPDERAQAESRIVALRTELPHPWSEHRSYWSHLASLA